MWFSFMDINLLDRGYAGADRATPYPLDDHRVLREVLALHPTDQRDGVLRGRVQFQNLTGFNNLPGLMRISVRT